MIYDNLKNIKHYKGQQVNFDIIIDYLETHDLNALPLGKNIIDENNYVMIFDNTLEEDKTQIFEAHQEYADLHMTLNGAEKVHYAPLEGLSITRAYVTVEDVVLGITEKYQSYLIDASSFTVFFPNEAHSVKNYAGYSQVKKAVFKFKNNPDSVF